VAPPRAQASAAGVTVDSPRLIDDRRASTMIVRLRELAMRAALTPLARRVERAAQDPRPAQEAALKKVLRACAASTVGARLGLPRVRTLEDLTRLPPSDYESIRADSDEVWRAGGRGRFGAGEVVALALSSGTTGAPKRIPVTRAFLAAHRRTMFTLQATLLDGSNAWRALAGGKQLLLGNSPRVETAPSGVPCGYMSGIVLGSSPRLMRRAFLPSPQILEEPRWERRLARILDEARGEDVRLIGAFPAALKNLTEAARARFGVDTLDRVWPNLRVLFFGGAPLSQPLRDELARRCRRDGEILFWENYSAIEALFGHGFRADWPGLVFSPFESVFLFAESATGTPLLPLDALEEGGRYHLFVTNQGGLVNYRMGDIIEVTSRRPLTFRVAGRAVDQVTLHHERITTPQAERAFAEGAPRAPSLDFALYLDEGPPCRVVWVLPWDADGTLVAALDAALGRANLDYARLRQAGVYGDAAAERLDAAGFAAYRDAHLGAGTFKEKKIFGDRATFRREYGLDSPAPHG
jgi:GH3 auxin-responsive promoter